MVLRLGLHDVSRGLKHAQRAAELFAVSEERVRLSPGMVVHGGAESGAAAIRSKELRP